MSSMTTSSPSVPAARRARFPGQRLLLLSRDPLGFLRSLDVPEASAVSVLGPGPWRNRVILLRDPTLVQQVLVQDAAQYAKGRGLQLARRLLGDGLLTSEGELHRRQRKILQPVFQPRHVESFAAAIQECSEEFVDGWRALERIEAGAQMQSLALKIVGRTLFGTELRDEIGETREALQSATELFRLSRVPLFSRLERWFPALGRPFEAARKRLDKIVRGLISEHREQPRHDLLARMLECPQMDDTLVRDEAMTLFLAGHETTAHALTFALYLLSRHPDVQSELREAVKDLSLRPEELAALPPMRNLVWEVLRLYPTAWILGRQARQATRVGPYHLAAGSTVLVSPYLQHRRADVFPEPERFNPRRWEAMPRPSLAKGAFLPFGAGPRVCIGEHFAMLEIGIVLATILRQWELLPCSLTEPLLRPRITLAPAEPITIPVRQLKLKKENDSR